MKERPILFSAPMVRAILAGTKTQTRRVVKGIADADLWRPIGPELFHPTIVDRHGDDAPGPECYGAGNDDGSDWVKCPYGQPGDRLWVRETFQPLFAEGFDHYTVDWETGKGYACRYVATDGRAEWIDGDDNITSRCKPGIHMPRWASRITLEVTAVRVERLQDISEADAMAEGAQEAPTPMSLMYSPTEVMRSRYREGYADLWEQINGPGSWDANPWVWCVEFRRT